MLNLSQKVASLTLACTALVSASVSANASEIIGEVFEGAIELYYLQCQNRNDCDLYEVTGEGLVPHLTEESLSSIDRELISEGRSEGWTYRRTDVNDEDCTVTVLDAGRLVNSGCSGI